MEDRGGSESPLVLHGGESSEFLSRMITKPGLALAVLFIATIVQIIRYGPSPRYWLLLIGSFLAAVFLFAFGMLIVIDAGKKRRGLVPMLVALGGYLPYLFGCYLVF